MSRLTVIVLTLLLAGCSLEEQRIAEESRLYEQYETQLLNELSSGCSPAKITILTSEYSNKRVKLLTQARKDRDLWTAIRILIQAIGALLAVSIGLYLTRKKNS